MNKVIKRRQFRNLIIGFVLDVACIVGCVYIRINQMRLGLDIPYPTLKNIQFILLFMFLCSSIVFLLIPIYKLKHLDDSFKNILNSGYLDEDSLYLDYNESKRFGKYRFGKYCIYVNTLYGINIIEMASVVWIYYSVTSRTVKKNNRLIIEQKYALHIHTKNKQHITITFSKPQPIEDVLSLYQSYPFIVFGHSEELMRKYKKDFNEFLEIAYNKS